MLTKNWYEYFRLYMGTVSVNIANEHGKVVDVNGSQFTPWTYSSQNSYIYPSTIYSNPFATKKTANGLHFGDGNTAPTKDDYYLSGNQITTLNRSSQVIENFFDGDTIGTRFALTVRNTGTSEVTVREMAWVINLQASNASKYFMLDRTVLDEPVTIAAGDYAVIRYTISFTMPIPT